MERVPGQGTRITFRWWLREMLGSAVGALLLALLLEFVLLGQGRIERVPLIWGVSFACGQAAALLTLFWYYLRGRRAAAMTDNGVWREKREMEPRQSKGIAKFGPCHLAGRCPGDGRGGGVGEGVTRSAGQKATQAPPTSRPGTRSSSEGALGA